MPWQIHVGRSTYRPTIDRLLNYVYKWLTSSKVNRPCYITKLQWLYVTACVSILLLKLHEHSLHLSSSPPNRLWPLFLAKN